MQWLSLLFSFFLGKFNVHRAPGLSLKEGINFLFEEAAYRSRKPTMMILGGLVSVALLCGGFFMGLIDLTSQYDRSGFVQASAASIAGFSLALIAIATFTWIFKSAWPGVKTAEKEEEKEAKVTPSSLEQALTLLVMDFIKEREFKRDERRHAHHPVPTQEQEPSPLYNN